MKTKFSKAVAASLIAAAMITPTVANIASINVSASQVLGETSFDYKLLPWHTCETSPARQRFAIEDGACHIVIDVAEGGDGEKWDLQFRHRNLNFKAGHTYKVSFKAKAKRSGMELCSRIGSIKGDEEYFVLNDDKMEMGPHMEGQWGRAATLSTSYQTFEGTFIPTRDLENVEWNFLYAKGTDFEGNAQDGDEIWFDDMSIECTTCPDDSGYDICGYKGGEPSHAYTNRDNSVRNAEELSEDGKMLNYISVNQLGYFPELAKSATFSDNAGDMVAYSSSIELTEDTYDFELVDAAADKVVFEGTSGKKFKDPDSGDNVCKLDFSEFTTPGEYYLRIKGEKWRSFSFRIGNDIYSESSHDLLTNALNYYYQNRSGIDIEARYITSGDKNSLAHAPSHPLDTAYVQKKWINTYDSHSDVTDTYASSRISANGGWYDAADHGKYLVSGGMAAWTLQNMYERTIINGLNKERFDDNSGACVVPESNNAVPDILDEVAYEIDWMSKMKVDEKEPTWGKYAGLYYHKLQDHKWVGIATRPYEYIGEWEVERIVKPPTFAATLNYAACAAQAARLWAPYDAEKAENYLNSAVEAYEAYMKHWYEYDSTTIVHPTFNIPCSKEEINETSLYAPMWQSNSGGAYGDDNVLDDAYWAACELFISASEMGEDELAPRFKKIIDDSEYAYSITTEIQGSDDSGFNNYKLSASLDTNYTASAGTLALALHSDLLSDTENSKIKEAVLAAADTYISIGKEQGYGIPYKCTNEYNGSSDMYATVYLDGYRFGSNAAAISNAVIMAYAFDLTQDIKYINGVSQGMNYLLGNNPLSFSYITGYGSYHAQSPHHKYWAYDLDRYFPKAPDGVLVGGPSVELNDNYIRAMGFEPGNTENISQRCYVDALEAWSVNSVGLDWNAYLAWVTAFLQDEADTSSTEDETVYGDANCDTQVNLADAVLIMQHKANPSKYNVTANGVLNGDVDETGNGLTNKDALKIQQFLLGLTELT